MYSFDRDLVVAFGQVAIEPTASLSDGCDCLDMLDISFDGKHQTLRSACLRPVLAGRPLIVCWLSLRLQLLFNEYEIGDTTVGLRHSGVSWSLDLLISFRHPRYRL